MPIIARGSAFMTTTPKYLHVGDGRQSAFEFNYTNESKDLSTWLKLKLCIGCLLAMPLGIALSTLLNKRILFANTYKEHGKIVKVTIMEIVK